MRSRRKRISQQAAELTRELVRLNTSKTGKRASFNIPEGIGYLIFRGFNVLSVLAGIWLLTVGFSDYQAAADFGNKAVATTGIIAETSYQSRTISSGGFPSSYIVKVPTIQFETRQGRIIRFEGDENLCTRSCRGKKVQVLYDSGNPHLAMIKGGSSPLNRARNNIGSGIFMTLVGILMFIIAPSEYGGRFNSTQRS